MTQVHTNELLSLGNETRSKLLSNLKRKGENINTILQFNVYKGKNPEVGDYITSFQTYSKVSTNIEVMPIIKVNMPNKKYDRELVIIRPITKKAPQPLMQTLFQREEGKTFTIVDKKDNFNFSMVLHDSEKKVTDEYTCRFGRVYFKHCLLSIGALTISKPKGQGRTISIVNGDYLVFYSKIVLSCPEKTEFIIAFNNFSRKQSDVFVITKEEFIANKVEITEGDNSIFAKWALDINILKSITEKILDKGQRVF